MVAPLRDSVNVRIRYKNPAVKTRAGKIATGSVVFEVEGHRFEVHTVYGVAQILARSAPRVHQLLEAEKLRGYRIGRDWVVLDVDLRRFIKEQRARVRKRFAALFKDEDLAITTEKNRTEKP